MSVLIDTSTTSLSMHRRVMHMHFSLLQQLHDHFPLVGAARAIYGELLFLLIVSTVDFSFYFYFQLSATSLLSYIYPDTNNSIENDIKINENSNFQSISFYSFLRNSLKTKLSLSSDYDIRLKNNNFSR